MTQCPRCGRPVVLPDAFLSAEGWMHKSCAPEASAPQPMQVILTPAASPNRSGGTNWLANGCLVVLLLAATSFIGCVACVRCAGKGSNVTIGHGKSGRH